MKRRAALYLFGTVFAVLVIAVAVIQSSRFEAFVCDEIERRAGAELGALVDIHHIQIKLIALQPRIELYDIKVFPKLPGKSGVADEPSFQAKEARVVIRPIQLWARQLDIDRVEIGEPHLDLTQTNGKWVGLPPGLFIQAATPSAATPAAPSALSVRFDAFVIENGILHLSAETNDLQLGLVGIDALGTFEANGNIVIDVQADGRRVMAKIGEDWFEEFIDSVEGELVVKKNALEIRAGELETDSLSVSLDGQIGLGATTDVQISRLHAIAPLEFVQRVAPATPAMLGQIDWTGSVIVNQKGVRARGLAKIDDFWLETFHFGKTEVDVEATDTGAKVKRASFDGAGGKVEGPIDVVWPDNRVAISAALNLDGVRFARILDMVGVTGSHVDMAVDGKVAFSGGVSPLAITGTADLQHDQFAWREYGWDQKSNGTAPIIHVPGGMLSGGFTVDDAGIGFTKVASTAGSTGLTLDGKLFFKGATDITFVAAPLALAEISPIGPIDIAGTGPVSARVHGEFQKLLIEGNLDLDGMKVAGFDFGKAKGPLVFDVGQFALWSDHMDFVRGKSGYGGDWRFSLADPPSLAFDVDVEPGARVQDLADIVFAGLGASKYAQGTIASGHIDLEGPLDKLSGKFRANGTDLAVTGEKFATFRANGRFREGAIFLDDVVTAKASGAQLFARGSLSPPPDGGADGLGQVVNLEAHTSKWQLSDIGALAKKDPAEDTTVESSIGMRLHVGGRIYRPEIKGRVDLGDTLLYGQPLGASQVNFDTVAVEPGGPRKKLVIDGAVAGTSIKPHLEILLESSSSLPYTADVVFSRHNLKPYFMALNPRIAKDPEVKASLKGLVKASGDLMKLGTTTVVGIVADALSFQRGPHQLFNKEPLVVNFGPGAKYELKQVRLHGADEETDFRLSGGRDGDKTEVIAEGKIDLAFAELATNAFTRVEGVLDVKSFAVRGDARGSTYGGVAEIEGGTFKTRFFPIGPEDVTATVTVTEGRIGITGLRGKLGGGLFEGKDSYVLLSDKEGCTVKEWALGPFNLTDVTMRFPSYAFSGRVTGDMRFEGNGCSEKALPVLSGELQLEEAKYNGPIEWKASTVALKAGATEVFVRSEDAPTFKLDVELRADDNVWVRNDLGNIEFRIDDRDPLRVVGDNTGWGILGSLRLKRGKMLLQSREFTMTNADISFDDERTVDFTYDVSAETLVREWQVTFRAKGRRSRGQPVLQYESVPPLSPEDVNLLLFSGLTAQEMKASGQDARVLGAIVGTTLGQGLSEQRGVTSKIKKALNLDTFDVVPSYTEGGAIGIKAVGRSTVNDDLSLNYSVGQSDRVSGSVQGDYRLSNRVHIVGGWSNEEQNSSTSSQQKPLNEQGDFSVDARFRFEWK